MHIMYLRFLVRCNVAIPERYVAAWKREHETFVLINTCAFTRKSAGAYHRVPQTADSDS